MKPQTPWTDAENRLRNCGHEIETAPDKLAAIANKAAEFITDIKEGYLNQTQVADRLHEIAEAYNIYKEHGVDKVQAAMADGFDREAQRHDQATSQGKRQE